MKFKIGQIVKFKNDDTTNYSTDHNGIPPEMIIHGIANVGKHYKEHFAKIVDIFKEFYIVSWINGLNREMRLGYKEESLELVASNWKDMFDMRNKK